MVGIAIQLAMLIHENQLRRSALMPFHGINGHNNAVYIAEDTLFRHKQEQKHFIYRKNWRLSYGVK